MGDPTAPACPPPDVLGAFVEGRMDGMERRAVQQHVASCSECAFAIGGTMRFRAADEDDVADPEDEAPKRWRWITAVAAALAVPVLLVIVWRAMIAGDPMRGLQRAVAQTSTRSVEGRIAAFRHARFHAPRSEALAIDPAVRIEAERLVRLTDDHASTLHARGIAALVLGRDRDAIALLESAARRAPQNASYWSDLSAALMTNRLRAALAAADRAIAIDPSLPAAHFNRGLALERLGLAGSASEAYRRSSALDADSAWAAEARRRQESIAR